MLVVTAVQDSDRGFVEDRTDQEVIETATTKNNSVKANDITYVTVNKCSLVFLQ